MNRKCLKNISELKNPVKRHFGGFTLVELLVVVLIIGILAAVALPQYGKAVRRTKAAKAQVYVRQLADAVERYFLSNGTYPKYFADLDMDFSSVFPNKLAHSELDQYSGGVTSTEVLANDEMELILYCRTYADACYSMIRIRDSNSRYSGCGFAFLHKNRPGYEQYDKTWVCHETNLRNGTPYCREIMGLKNLVNMGHRVVECSYPLP